MERKPYETDLTDAEWEKLAPLLPPPKRKPGGPGRPPKADLREVFNAIRYLVRTSCSWALLPHDFPPRSTVFGYFTAWRKSGWWEKTNDLLRAKVREKAGRDPQPSAACLDSQSVKSCEGGADIGYDAGKKVHGRKRHLLVDMLGLVVAVFVSSAGVQDRDGARTLLEPLADGREAPRLELVWADGGYRGGLVDWADQDAPFRIEVVEKDPEAKGFCVVRKRWVVERTFAWLVRHRRLARDYERLPANAEAMIHVAMIGKMLRDLV